MDKSQKIAVFRLFAKAIVSQNGQNCPYKNEGNTQNMASCVIKDFRTNTHFFVKERP